VWSAPHLSGPATLGYAQKTWQTLAIFINTPEFRRHAMRPKPEPQNRLSYSGLDPFALSFLVGAAVPAERQALARIVEHAE